MSKENELVAETEGVSRRGFLKGIGSGAVAASVAPAVLIGSEETSNADTIDEITQTYR